MKKRIYDMIIPIIICIFIELILIYIFQLIFGRNPEIKAITYVPYLIGGVILGFLIAKRYK